MPMKPPAVGAAPLSATPRFLQPFAGKPVSPPPIWLMRQAGRYLPEYRAVRGTAGSFLDLCYNPALATEVTLQPIRRYGFDAAILFSDILVVPHALGQDVSFVEGEGPKLDPIREAAHLARLYPGRTGDKFGRVFETVARIRQDLPKEVALVGFCGAPWTVATYMVEGQGSKDQQAARLWAYRDPEGFRHLIDLLVEVSVEYLSGQVDAGAQALQIFDTWAGSLAETEFERWVIEPTRTMVQRLKARYPSIPILGFPRGAGSRLALFPVQTGVDALSLDVSVPIGKLRASLGPKVVTQGNLDPLALVAGGKALEEATRRILRETRGTPHIFNLGHGIVPQTPPEHVARLVELVRGG